MCCTLTQNQCRPKWVRDGYLCSAVKFINFSLFESVASFMLRHQWLIYQPYICQLTSDISSYPCRFIAQPNIICHLSQLLCHYTHCIHSTSFTGKYRYFFTNVAIMTVWVVLTLPSLRPLWRFGVTRTLTNLQLLLVQAAQTSYSFLNEHNFYMNHFKHLISWFIWMGYQCNGLKKKVSSSSSKEVCSAFAWLQCSSIWEEENYCR